MYLTPHSLVHPNNYSLSNINQTPDTMPMSSLSVSIDCYICN